MELVTSSLYSDANPQGYWRMEGNSNDSKGSNNGSDTTIAYSSGNGKYGQGAGFGTSSIILWGTEFQPTTLNWWINPTTLGDMFVTLVSSNVIQTKATNKLSIYDGTSDKNSNVTIDTGAWQMFTLVYSAVNTYKIYKNGVYQEDLATAGQIKVKQAGRAAAAGFAGAMDDVSWFNRVLTPTEILSLYQDADSSGYVFISQ